MLTNPRIPALFIAALLTAPAEAGEGTRPRPAQLCPQDAPDGVRLPDRPGCAARVERRTREADGFREIGGVRLRVGGRVSADVGGRR